MVHRESTRHLAIFGDQSVSRLNCHSPFCDATYSIRWSSPPANGPVQSQMAKPKHARALSLADIAAFREKLLENCASLISDAELLFSRHRYARSFALSVSDRIADRWEFGPRR
jgi:hypothetical protein